MAAAEPPGPPKSGYAVRYERLLVEERSLENDREGFLKSDQRRVDSSSSSSTTNDAEVQALKTRGMVHRASLGGMLIAAQHAADDARSGGGGYEQGLERPDAKNALAALHTTKSRQLEEDDNKLPLAIGSESLAWRQRLSSRFGSGASGAKRAAVLEASADDFFCSFPECRRRDDASCYSEMDESDSDSDDDIETKKPKAKKTQQSKKVEVGGIKSEPVVVTSCPSSSPSPERLLEKPKGSMGHESNAAKNNINGRENQPMGNQQNQPPPIRQHPPNNNQWNNHQHPPNNNNRPYQHPQQQRSNNPYQRQHQHQQQRGPQQKQWQYGNRQQHQCQNQPSSFDYNDNNSCNNVGPPGPPGNTNPFVSAGELPPDFNEKLGNNGGQHNRGNNCNNNQRRMGGGGGPERAKQMGGPKKNIPERLQKNKFRTPFPGKGGGDQAGSSNNNNNGPNNSTNRQAYGGGGAGGGNGNDDDLPEELKGCEKEMIEKINNEIVNSGEKVSFDDIAGLKGAKDTVNELVIMPLRRPDLFTGLRSIPQGLLLFGPPGTGKTMIGKAIANESGSTFFSISSSSLTSKWIGEGEKMVKTLFCVANYRAPSVVFIDEVDSLLTQRKSDENEASRRIKTEFLVQMEGAGNCKNGHILLIGATNLPQELDDAARRRFIKKIYIPLPDFAAREALLNNLLNSDGNRHSLTKEDVKKLAHDTDGYSGADLKNLSTDAAMGPLRRLGPKALEMHLNDLPPISYKDFRKSLRNSNPSVAQSDLAAYIEWNNTYGNRIANNDESCDSDAGDEN